MLKFHTAQRFSVGSGTTQPKEAARFTELLELSFWPLLKQCGHWFKPALEDKSVALVLLILKGARPP